MPNCIECNGRLFSIKTDFREWLKFGELIKRKDLKAKQVLYLFKNEIPSENPFQALLDFYVNPNVTPRKQENDDGRIILDYIEDGEYIVGSFMAVYGINLITIDYLHWHEFQALFRSLPEDSKIMQIISRRAYKKTNKSMDSQLQEVPEMKFHQKIHFRHYLIFM